MNLTKYKIRSILLTGFGIIIFLNVLLALFFYFQIHNLSTINEDLYSHPLVVSNSVRDIEISYYAMNRVMKNALIISDPDQLSSAINDIDSLEKDVFQKFSVVRKQFLGDPKDVEEAYQHYLNWKVNLDEVMTEINKGNRNLAADIVNNKGMINFTDLVGVTRKMIAFASNKAVTFYKGYDELHRSLEKMLLIFSLFIFGSCIIIALLITKSITDPINKIIRKIIVISKNYFNVDISFEGNHHLTLLDQSIDKIKELSEHLKTEFDEKAKIQTEYEDQKSAMIYLLEDVNEIKAELEKTVTQLQSSNKELESFIYSVSHDLRAPLRSIMGFTQIISKRHIANLSAEGLEYFNYVLEASKNMADLIEDLLRFARLAKSPFQKEMINPNEIVEVVKQNLTADILENNAKIITPKDMPLINSDRTLFGQIFLNLFHNAIMYHRDGIEPEIVLSVDEVEDNLLLRIKDNGQGIPKEHHERVFNIFQRLHPSDKYPGTGIGLAIVKKAVEALGWKITIESQVNVGTSFILTIPKK